MLVQRGRVATRLSIALAGCLAALATAVGAAPVRAGTGASASSAYSVALDYVARFYPRWLTYEQELRAPHNRLVGPRRMNALYGEVVAPNDDTLYASSFVNVAEQPVVLTIPPTRATYSLLTADMYGDVFKTTIEPGTPGTYVLTGPEWHGTLPAGTTQVKVPIAFTQWIFRADKFSAGGANEKAAAEAFRRKLRIATLSQYESEPASGATAIVSVALFGVRYKLLADDAIAKAPIEFLVRLQQALRAPTSAPLTGSNLRVSEEFDRLFHGGHVPPAARAQFARGARAAHALIVARYVTHTDAANWISFDDMGEWGNRYVDRSAIAEFIQWGNNLRTAAYFQAFEDGAGRRLNGRAHRYVLRFAKGELPRAKRFWSLTAYVPRSITLVSNKARKYLVASYTPGLKAGRDGSVSIYMAAKRPRGVPAANWLPVPRGSFNVMLRVYGPEGTVAEGDYTPPAVQLLR